MDIKKIEAELYLSKHNIPRNGDCEELWNRIKNNAEILKEAIKTTKDKWGIDDIMCGNTICSFILMHYNEVDQQIYLSLVKKIYENKSIARIVMNGASNGGYSFLLMTLFNDNLVLTNEQKLYAVDEAMYKVGTTRYIQIKNSLREYLIKQGYSKDEIATQMWLWIIGYRMSSHQAHGTGEFDIRYHILKNPNWTLEEKRQLIYEFWYNPNTYDEFLEQWEWGIINDNSNFKDGNQLDKANLLYYSYDDIFSFYNDKETADRIWKEIEFCRTMHSLRPMQWELEDKSTTKKLEI